MSDRAAVPLCRSLVRALGTPTNSSVSLSKRRYFESNQWNRNMVSVSMHLFIIYFRVKSFKVEHLSISSVHF